MSAPPRRLLRLEDITDLRAYERERDAIRRDAIALKKLRRVSIGPIVSVLFENAHTVRYQVQEMVRAERLLDDARVQAELDAYNPLIPAPGELSLTMFLELTSDEQLRRWLPALVGIERSVVLRAGTGEAALEARGEVEAGHASLLTREETTSSVHYVRIALGEDLAARLVAGPAEIAVRHPAYVYAAELGDQLRRSLAADWD